VRRGTRISGSFELPFSWAVDTFATTWRSHITSREPRVNDRIRAREVRLVDPEGGQIGIKSIEEARWLADQLELDLVEVAPDARPPVVRLMDYGKFKYEQSVRAREARKKQTRTIIKEVQFRPKIGDGDFEVKRKRVERFLGEGDKVKVTMRFRGREVTHPEIGHAILRRLAEGVESFGVIETPAAFEGRQITMVLAPVKRSKTEDDRGETEHEETIPAGLGDLAGVEAPADSAAPAEPSDAADSAESAESGDAAGSPSGDEED
jgi:translation initiation factor IF-3